ncbi:3-deoxy-D-manno-octulosonic acid kinase [Vibrio astriarenae]|nr:3-deoxy-D-manno-octulosonic acid kinase [Vibrio sp. C7]
MFKQHTCGNTTYWYDPQLLEEAVTDAFNLDFWRSQDAILGSAQGRGTTWFVAGRQGEYAIRHYYRGGMLGNFVRDHYLYTGSTILAVMPN